MAHEHMVFCAHGLETIIDSNVDLLWKFITSELVISYLF